MHALLPAKRMPRVSELGRHSEKKVSDCAWQRTVINPQIALITASVLRLRVTSLLSPSLPKLSRKCSKARSRVYQLSHWANESQSNRSLSQSRLLKLHVDHAMKDNCRHRFSGAFVSRLLLAR